MTDFNYKTLSKTILADLYTPVGVYMRLRDLYPQSALMESSDYHDANNSRSFIGINPMASVAIGHGVVSLVYPDGTTERKPLTKDFGSAEAIHSLIDRIQVTGDDASIMGLFGYTSFNAVRYFENIDVKDETQAKNDAPDMLYILYKVVIVFDHHNNLLKVVGLNENDNDNQNIDGILKAMNKASVKAYDFHPVGDVRFSISEVSVFSVRRPRRTVALRAGRLTSIQLPVRPSARAMPRPTDGGPNFYATTLRRMPST